MVATDTRQAAAPRGRRGGTPLIGLLPLLLALGAWQVFGDPRSPYFPPPSEWVAQLGPMFSDQELLGAIGATLLTFVLALLLATVLGATLGTTIGASRRADRALGPALEFVRAMPASALVPLAALVIGYTIEMKLVVVVLPATWPVLLTCRAARRSMSSLLLEVPRTLGLSRREGITKVLVPTLIPAVLLGVRLAAPLALIITLLVEILTRINGLGAMLGHAQANFQSAQVYALLVIAGLMGLAVNWVMMRCETAVSLRMRGEVLG